MKTVTKSFSLLLCLMMVMVFSIVPTIAAPESASSSTATTTATKAPASSSTTTTTKKTTKGTTATTKKTTKATSSSSNGKLTVSSKRSDSSTGDSGKVVVIYTINNTGSVTAKNIKLKDADIAGSKTITTIDSLAAGASKTVEYEATMTRDSTSTPVVTCTMNGSSKTFTGENVTITLKGTGSSLSATLTTTSTGIQPNTPVKFSLLLKNDATSRVTDISIADYAGKTIKSGITLEAGSTTNVDFELTLTGDTNVYVTVKGKNSSGSEITSKSNELAMKADANAVPVTEGLSILIHADKTELEKAGEVQLTLEVKNLMPKAYTNVSIIDKASGTNLQTISLLSGNDSKTYTSTITIEENTSFLYEATATYEDGTAVTIQSNSLEIIVGGGGLFSGGMGIILVIVIIVVVLIIATSVTLYILSKKEKEQKKSIGAAQSEKYRKTTPKKKGRVKEVAPPPQQPLSTFTIEEEINNAVASMETPDIQIPNNSHSFDDYGASDAFDASNLENTNPTPTFDPYMDEPSYKQPEADTTYIEPASYESTNSYEAPIQDTIGIEPVSQTAPQQPMSREPMNYNDLDPD